jgi:Cdc6-like AAA superfamily ATPase
MAVGRLCTGFVRCEMAKINPFAPNSPAPPGMFVGRGAELLKLQSCFAQTKAGLPANFMVTGERGIGKSSLLNYVKHLAEGRAFLDDTVVSFLVIDTDIDPNTTQLVL